MHLNITENIFAGAEITRRGLLQRKEMRRQTEKVLRYLKSDLTPDMRMSDLTSGQQKIVEIAKALVFKSNVIILDEPTASFSSREIDTLLEYRQDHQARRNRGHLHLASPRRGLRDRRSRDRSARRPQGQHVPDRRAHQDDADQGHGRARPVDLLQARARRARRGGPGSEERHRKRRAQRLVRAPSRRSPRDRRHGRIGTIGTHGGALRQRSARSRRDRDQRQAGQAVEPEERDPQQDVLHHRGSSEHGALSAEDDRRERRRGEHGEHARIRRAAVERRRHRREVRQAAEHQGPERAHPGRQSLGRQPAEGGAGQVVQHRAARSTSSTSRRTASTSAPSRKSTRSWSTC